MKSLLTISLLILFTPMLFAETATTRANQGDYFYSNSDAYNPNGAWLFLGSNVGLIDLSESSRLPNRSGHQVNFKVVGSLYKLEKKLITDLGLGFQSNTASGFGTEFTTQSFFIDANARWEFARRWSLGPVVNLLIGNKNSFTNESKAFASFVGGTIHYRHPVNRFWLLKVGARVLTDLDISSRQVTKWLLDFQIGFPPTNKSQSNFISEDSTSSINSEVVLEADNQLNDISFNDNTNLSDYNPDLNTANQTLPEKVNLTEVNDAELEDAEFEATLEDDTPSNQFATFKDLKKTNQKRALLNIKVDELKYGKGQIQPSARDEQYIQKLALVLSENQHLFDKVNIKGHAGDFKRNNKVGNTNRIISYSRANDILKKLATNGLPSSKMFSMSFGEYTPYEVNSKQQKVELEFSGVSDEAQLKKLIKSIKR